MKSPFFKTLAFCAGSIGLVAAVFAAPETPAAPAASTNQAAPFKIRSEVSKEGTNPLVYDAMEKSVTTQGLQTSNTFVFWVTNTAKTNVTIDHLQPGCGCTVAKMPK